MRDSEQPVRSEQRPADADRALIRRVADGEEAALSELYDRFSGTVNALALRVLKDTADAEEVVQEVFLQVWNRARRYDPGRASVSTWLMLLARSRAIDRLRSRRVVDRTHDEARHEADLHESARGTRRVQEKERRRRIGRAMADLPEEQRRVLRLAYYGGMTQSEIAASEGIPLGTVKTRTLLAMKKLRAALRDDLRELL